MKKTTKKLFSLFLAVLMLLSCFPLAAAAQGGDLVLRQRRMGLCPLPLFFQMGGDPVRV